MSWYPIPIRSWPWGLLGVVVLTVALLWPADAQGQTRDRVLVIEQVEVRGNTRTQATTILDAYTLRVGDPADPTEILRATETLSHGTLVRSAKAHTRPGSAPGNVVVVLEIEESRPHFRFGAGNEDLSGWYLIPVEFNLDNLTGHGESLDLGLRFGYRLLSLDVNFRSTLTPDTKPYWEAGFHAQRVDRVYYFQGTEVNQAVKRTRLVLGGGSPLGSSWHARPWLVVEHVEADSGATVYRDREVLGRNEGDAVPFDQLPSGIQSGVAERDQVRFGGSLTWDTRSGSNLAQRGAWGRLEAEGVASSESPFARGDLLVRGFQPVVGGVLLAGKLDARAASAGAPFYERPYLGGLYTIRGFPSQSLSPPEGDQLTVTGSVEVRMPWIGTPENPRLTGLLFLDVGAGWGDAREDQGPIEAGIGYGFRVGVPWLQQLGLDIGLPLTDSPVKESFHANLSLWWTF